MSNDPATCPDCGAPRLAGGRHSLCPRCLLKVGMSVGADDEWMDDPFDCGMAAPREAPGTVIGRYTLLEEIGEGGFGIVYLAEQAAPVKRKVALKILKPGMDTREVVARFRVERQALALMDHPHIAQVYDGGATDSGRPYFVMELVNGTPITSYCADRELTTRQRLELFLDVTSAVQHAHNPHFPALRSGPLALSGASRRKQIPCIHLTSRKPNSRKTDAKCRQMKSWQSGPENYARGQ